MGKTLLTGGTGFVGSHLARALARRGDELRLLIRSSSDDAHLAGIDYERVNGEVTDRRAVRRAMKGVERVFHVAGLTSLRSADKRRVFAVNVDGTRIICEEALEVGVERLVHTSSVAGIGPARKGERADESQSFTAGRLALAYMNSKHEGEVEALRIGAHGLDVVVVNPTFVLGPDDPKGTSMGLVKRFLLRRIPFYVDGGINVVDVRDVASGHLLAEQEGRAGERYILGGRNFTLRRLFADLERISGVPGPALQLPIDVAVGGAWLAERLGIPFASSVDETRSAALWWTYSSAKAKRELGFKPRSQEETLEDAVGWQTEQLGERIGGDPGVTYDAAQLLARVGGAVRRLVPR